MAFCSPWGSQRVGHDLATKQQQYIVMLGFLGGSVVKNLPATTGDGHSFPGSRRSSGKGNGNPLQYSCLGNPMDKGVQWATVHDTSSVRHDLVTKEEQQEDRLAFVFCKSLELGLAIAGVNTYFSEKVVGYQEDTYC